MNNSKFWILSLSLLLTINANALSSCVSAALSTDKSQYLLRETINFHVVLRNVCKQSIYIPPDPSMIITRSGGITITGSKDDVSFGVVSVGDAFEGSPAPLANKNPSAWIKSNWKKLSQGEILETQLRSPVLRGPGKYRLRITFYPPSLSHEQRAHLSKAHIRIPSSKSNSNYVSIEIKAK